MPRKQRRGPADGTLPSTPASKAPTELAHRLSFKEALGGSEIAGTLGVTKSTVSKMIAKAESGREHD